MPEGVLPARAFVRGLFHWDGFQLNFWEKPPAAFPDSFNLLAFFRKANGGPSIFTVSFDARVLELIQCPIDEERIQVLLDVGDRRIQDAEDSRALGGIA